MDWKWKRKHVENRDLLHRYLLKFCLKYKTIFYCFLEFPDFFFFWVGTQCITGLHQPVATAMIENVKWDETIILLHYYTILLLYIFHCLYVYFRYSISLIQHFIFLNVDGPVSCLLLYLIFRIFISIFPGKALELKL